MIMVKCNSATMSTTPWKPRIWNSTRDATRIPGRKWSTLSHSRALMNGARRPIRCSRCLPMLNFLSTRSHRSAPTPPPWLISPRFQVHFVDESALYRHNKPASQIEDSLSDDFETLSIYTVLDCLQNGIEKPAGTLNDKKESTWKPHFRWLSELFSTCSDGPERLEEFRCFEWTNLQESMDSYKKKRKHADRVELFDPENDLKIQIMLASHTGWVKKFHFNQTRSQRWPCASSKTKTT
jgi:hypothetical protein